MQPIFSKIAEIQRDRSGPNLKIADFGNSNSEILKEKNLEKLCKKLDEILRTLVDNFFFQISTFCWIKFKLNKKRKNGPTWPTTHVYSIRSHQLDNIVDSGSPFTLIERGAEASPRGPKSAAGSENRSGSGSN